MSVRELLFLHTRRSVAEVAGLAADLFGGQWEDRGDHAYFTVDTARLVLGASGEFGGPVRRHHCELPFRPVGEFEATDGYTVEVRLWQAYGKRLAADGTDVEAVAASVVFDALAQSLNDPVIHVHGDDTLVSASLPGKGIHHPPVGTSIYDWDSEKWDGFVLLPD
jgi:hypothetical protein